MTLIVTNYNNICFIIIIIIIIITTIILRHFNIINQQWSIIIFLPIILSVYIYLRFRKYSLQLSNKLNPVPVT